VKLPADAPQGFQWGGANSDEALAITISSKGYAYVGGYVNGNIGQTNNDPSGDAKAVLLTVGEDPENAGTLAYWQKDFKTQDGKAQTIEALALHPDTGDLYFAGRTNGAFPGFSNQGQFDYFIGGPGAQSKLDILYQGGKPSPQRPRRLAFDARRDLIVAGYDDVFVPSNYVEAWEDPFIIKLRPQTNGTWSELWYHQFQTAQTDFLGGLAVEQTGTEPLIYISGVHTSGMQRGMFVKKFDAQGQFVSNHRQSQIGYDMTQALHLLPDGSLLTASSTFAMLGDVSYGQQDVVVQKLNPATWEVLWSRQFGSAESDWVTDMAVDAAGNIFVVGETLGSVQRDFVPKGSFDVFMLKLDPSGMLLEARQWGSEEDDHPAAVAVDACGEAFIVGYTAGNLMGTNEGTRDAFIITTAKQQAP
jgi:hypothetical protein